MNEGVESFAKFLKFEWNHLTKMLGRKETHAELDSWLGMTVERAVSWWTWGPTWFLFSLRRFPFVAWREVDLTGWFLCSKESSHQKNLSENGKRWWKTPSGGKKRDWTSLRSTLRMTKESSGWRSWTLGTGSLSSECTYFLPNRFHGYGPKVAVGQLVPSFLLFQTLFIPVFLCLCRENMELSLQPIFGTTPSFWSESRMFAIWGEEKGIDIFIESPWPSF